MPENILKIPQSASPPVRNGAGDISERELTRERYNLNTTPTTRVQPAHPKKQLFSAPVNKFTARGHPPSPNLARIRSCLEEFRTRTTPTKPAKIGPKAASMEDLTPSKKFKRGSIRKDTERAAVRSPRYRSVAEEQASSRIGTFMLVSSWRRRRDEVRCLRKTLEFQVICSERLRIQISALKSLLDSDNAKVRMAMKELERLKQLVRDKDTEKAVLEKEKRALEEDVCSAEDRASEFSIGWRNTRNELDAARVSLAACERALSSERTAAAEAGAQRDRCREQLSVVEEELARHVALLSSAEAEVAALRREADQKQKSLNWTVTQLKMEQEARFRSDRERRHLSVRLARSERTVAALRVAADALRDELALRCGELAKARESLRWWPRSVRKMLEAAKFLFRNPKSLHEAFVWYVIPARHGC